VICPVEPTISFPSVSTLTNGPSSRVSVEEGTVDLWSYTLEASAPDIVICRNWLSGEERIRADRFVRSQDQTHFVLAHGALRYLLAQYTTGNAAALRFKNGPTGKPALLSGVGGHELHFNLSHSHGRMLVAVARQEVGIDLEEVRDKGELLKLAERFYTPVEYAWIREQTAAEQPVQFYRLWVAKEAVLKGLGLGISSLHQCEIVTPAVLSRGRPRRIPGNPLDGWTVQWLNCGPGWQGAVAASGDKWSVRVRGLDGC
jgi:4'-phosphopantetheinyl transferase